jgi:hypothetical protein
LRDIQLGDARLYTAQIHKYFSARSGKPPVLTIGDWTCIRKWQEEGIPLECVFNGIDRAFSMDSGEVTSLRHCAGAVLEVWRLKLCS